MLERGHIIKNENQIQRRSKRRVEKMIALAQKKEIDRSQILAKRLIKLALEKKGEDLIVLDVRGVSSYTDYIIIVSARSVRHAQGIAEAVEDELYREGFSPHGVEGKGEGQWVLMDYGDAILHIFFEPIRKIYDLEGLWIDVPRIEPKDWGIEYPEEEK